MLGYLGVKPLEAVETKIGFMANDDDHEADKSFGIREHLPNLKQQFRES